LVRGAAKPIPTPGNPLPSVDLSINEPTKAPYVRSDVCVLPAISIIGEAVMAETLCRFFLERFGGDCMEQVVERFER